MYKLEDAIAKTNELLLQDNIIIFEAAIKYNNFLVRIDILIKRNNSLKLIEIKPHRLILLILHSL